jgi:hypothetical protein
MAIFQIKVWDKSKKNKSILVWNNSVVADDIEKAYVIGKAQFELEKPELPIENYSIEASGTSFAKQGI